MNRKNIRYVLFRLKSQEEGVSDASDVIPENFEKTFSSQKKFRGWSSFGVTWDVGGRVPDEFNPLEDATSKEDSPWVIVMRDESIDEAWNKVLQRVVTPLPEVA